MPQPPPIAAASPPDDGPPLFPVFSDDPFDFFRWWLGTIVTIYATIITLQSLWGWYAWLAGSDKYMSLLRRYLVVHGLRLRFKTFWGDVIICGLLTVAFGLLWHAHNVIFELGSTLQYVRKHAR